jgi:hypothetical protein
MTEGAGIVPFTMVRAVVQVVGGNRDRFGQSVFHGQGENGGRGRDHGGGRRTITTGRGVRDGRGHDRVVRLDVV